MNHIFFYSIEDHFINVLCISIFTPQHRSQYIKQFHSSVSQAYGSCAWTCLMSTHTDNIPHTDIMPTQLWAGWPYKAFAAQYCRSASGNAKVLPVQRGITLSTDQPRWQFYSSSHLLCTDRYSRREVSLELWSIVIASVTMSPFAWLEATLDKRGVSTAGDLREGSEEITTT